jgi:SEL1 protein
MNTGADLVDEAMLELGRIPKWSYKRTTKSSSIFVKIFDWVMHSLPSGPTMAPTEDEPSSPTIKGPLLNAVRLLDQAASRNNSDALSMLADFNFFGNYSHPRDLHKAFEHYKELATSRGNTTAQFMLGLYYSTGLAGVVPRNQATALLYYTVAAARGDIRAEMAMGFRHHSGIGATKSCPRAIKHYKHVADKAIAWYRSGPPGGRSWVPQSWRIVDDDGGVYGEGASASSSGIHAYKPSPQSDAYAAVGDVMEYLDFLSRKGDWAATLDLGRRYYEGRHN